MEALTMHDLAARCVHLAGRSPELGGSRPSRVARGGVDGRVAALPDAARQGQLAHLRPTLSG